MSITIHTSISTFLKKSAKIMKKKGKNGTKFKKNLTQNNFENLQHINIYLRKFCKY